MKKAFLPVLLASSICALNALSIDPAKASADFTAYKAANKVPVPGSFNEPKFSFKTTSGSVAEILSGAKANIDFNKIETKNPGRNKNITSKLVAHMGTPEIVVDFLSAKGSDTSGEIEAQVQMNGVKKPVAMKYSVENGVLTASGEINQLDFMPAAFDKFKNDKVIMGLHGKVTHPEVSIKFSAPVK